jgi:hypothetical protein
VERVTLADEWVTGKMSLLTGLCVAPARQSRPVRLSSAKTLVDGLVKAKQQVLLLRWRER